MKDIIRDAVIDELQVFIRLGAKPSHWDSRTGICNNVSKSVGDNSYLELPQGLKQNLEFVSRLLFRELGEYFYRQSLVPDPVYTVCDPESEYDSTEQYYKLPRYENKQLQLRIQYAQMICDHVKVLDEIISSHLKQSI